MRFAIYQDTALGARASNQDRMGYCFTRDSLLMIVADGMGGHVRGEIAAQIALQTTAGLFQQQAKPRIADPGGFLDQALRRAHREILRYQATERLPESPRTTVVAALVQDGRAWWAHAGDSRLYWVREQALQSRTLDHSKVQSLVSLGLIRADEQETHPERNKVLSCLGSPFEPMIESTGPVELAPGDQLLLCSDGVWAAFGEARMVELLHGREPQASVPELVARAVEAQGRLADNATAIGFRWGGVDVVDELALPDGAVTTTIPISALDEPPPDEGPLSEEEIERTIAEIRMAIEKTTVDRLR